MANANANENFKKIIKIIEETGARNIYLVSARIDTELIQPLQKENEELKQFKLEIMKDNSQFHTTLKLEETEELLEAEKKENEEFARQELIWGMTDEQKAKELQLEAEKKKVEEFVNAIKYFCDRVEAGTIRSKTTYQKYKELLTKFKEN